MSSKKAAYGALADVLENSASREELIGQLRKVAATPPPEPVPTITPPEVLEETTVLENVTNVTRHYGDELASASRSCIATSRIRRTKPLTRKVFIMPPRIF